MKPAAIVCLFALVFATGRTCMGTQALNPGNTRKTEAVSAKAPQEKLRMQDIKTKIKAVGPSTVSSVPIEFEVINRSSTPVRFCTYQTPLEHKVTSGTMFKIVDGDGKELDYEGIQMKRRPPGRDAGDYMTLAPGKRTSAQIDLAGSYDWQPGSFRITFLGNEFLNELPPSNTIDIEIKR